MIAQTVIGSVEMSLPAAVYGVLMFFVAAILEGVFRQLISNTPGRFAVAAATAIAWLIYFVRPFGKQE